MEKQRLSIYQGSLKSTDNITKKFTSMPIKHLTLTVTLAITILLIGLLGLGLVFSTDSTYRQLSFKQQKQALNNLLSIKSRDLTNKLIQRQKELGFVLQSEETFKKSFAANDIMELNYWLDQEFNRYFSTMGLIKLEKLIVYDKDFSLISMSGRGIAMSERDTAPCYSLIKYVSQSSVTARLKPRSELCLYDNKPLLSTIVSIGSLRSRGYIQIVSDPAYILADIEQELDVQLQISTYDNILLHQSKNWPTDKQAIKSHLFSEYTIQAASGTPIMLIKGATDIHDFYIQLNQNRQKIIIASCLLIITTLVFILVILRRSLRPLKSLQVASEKISQGHFSEIKEEGFPEFSTPIRSFNKMASSIRELIQELNNEVSKRKTTEEKLQKTITTAKHHSENLEQQKSFLHMTMQSIVDGVITTNTSGHITSMNPVAEVLTGWPSTEALNKPFAQVMHVLYETSQERIYTPIEDIENKSVLDEPISAILIQHGSNIQTPVEYVSAPMLDENNNMAGSVVIIHDESKQRSLNRQLSFQTTHDALTGLINRYNLKRKLHRTLLTAKEKKIASALCYLEINELKVVNDTCGHNAGDELLKQVTPLFIKQIHEEDALARLGGDRFALLLEDCDIERAEAIAVNILQAVSNYNFSWEKFNFTINISVGIAAITDEHESIAELLSNADSACHLAKENGRSRLHIYTREDNQVLTQQRDMHWVSRINHALEENRFQLYIQEIIPLQHEGSKLRRHGEILLRMIDKQGEVISPEMFLQAAERYDMIETIDEWVIGETLKWLSRTQNTTLVSINVSGKSISNNDFINCVTTKIKDSKINPQLLCFEISETAAINNMTNAIHFMTALKKLGCAFALDNFGSGLSSFSYLTNLPVDYLKIDGALVVDIDKDPIHCAMVKSINDVGHVMGFETIAEFATSTRIIECLREIGTDYAQGYAVEKPVLLTSFGAGDDSGKPRLSAV